MPALMRVGVIGCGYWGPKLVRNLHDMPDVELALVADLRQDRLAQITELYPAVSSTTNHREIIDGDVDAVIVATPIRSHFRLAREALLAGKHVLVEKPITLRSEEAQELIELAESKNLILMVGHTFQFNPAVEAVRTIIQSQQLGQIFYMDATRVNLGLFQPDINVMWDLAPHDISLLRYVLEAEVRSISARGATYVNRYHNLPEVVYLNIKFEGGVMANVRLSWLDPVKERRLIVVGSQKMLVYDDLAEHASKVVIYDKGVDIPPYSITEAEFRASYRHGNETHHPLEWREPLNLQCSHFVDCIRTGAKPRSSGLDGLKVVSVLETAQRSLQNGGVELLVEY
jgi:predicted dehydrogenase